MDSHSREILARGQGYSARRISGSDWLAWFLRGGARWAARSRQRRALSKLDDRLLDDIGLTRQQAEAEAVKPPWE
jgi:uncharacterized protein YjiS (DUF1127 family)